MSNQSQFKVSTSLNCPTGQMVSYSDTLSTPRLLPDRSNTPIAICAFTLEAWEGLLSCKTFVSPTKSRPCKLLLEAFWSLSYTDTHYWLRMRGSRKKTSSDGLNNKNMFTELCVGSINCLDFQGRKQTLQCKVTLVPLPASFSSYQSNITIFTTKRSIHYTVQGFKPTTFRTWDSSCNH